VNYGNHAGNNSNISSQLQETVQKLHPPKLTESNDYQINQSINHSVKSIKSYYIRKTIPIKAELPGNMRNSSPCLDINNPRLPQF